MKSNIATFSIIVGSFIAGCAVTAVFLNAVPKQQEAHGGVLKSDLENAFSTGVYMGVTVVGHDPRLLLSQSKRESDDNYLEILNRAIELNRKISKAIDAKEAK